jgi:hypothetical protein
MVLNFRSESDLIKDAIKSQHNEVLACLALTWFDGCSLLNSCGQRAGKS